MVWAFTWLVFKSPQWSAKRVNRRKRIEKKEVTGQKADVGGLASPERIEYESGPEEQSESQSSPEPVIDTPESGDSPSPAPNGSTLRQRKMADGEKQVEVNGNATTLASEGTRKIGGMNDGYEYYWQPYPETYLERFDWLLDLTGNFRGPGWNWSPNALPTIPAAIRVELGEPVTPASKTLVSNIGLRSFMTRRELLKHELPKFILGYFALDIFKMIMKQDPYYTFGPNTYDSPWYYPENWILRRLIRQSISTFAVLTSLEMMFLLAPAIECIILGPKLLGLRAEPWYFATNWGNWSNIMNRGLNGLWGSWWHQTFRVAFAAPNAYLIKRGYIKPHTLTERLSALFWAFALSGVLHSGASYSMFPTTYPIDASIFFMLQALGVYIQMNFCNYLRPQIRKLSKPVRQACNLLYTFGWLAVTGYWLCDDFARGGIWLYEPIPMSPLRALGLGEKGDSWWCWDSDHIHLGWYSPLNRWHLWEYGISL